MPYFLQHFSKNWVKTLVHGTLQKKLLISEIDKFWWFFSKCPTFCNIFLKIGFSSARYFAEKVAYLEKNRQVLVVFQQMPYFLQHFSKNWVKTLVHGTLQKKLLISRRSTSFGGFSANALLFATFF